MFIYLVALGLPVTSLVAQTVKRLSTVWETWVRSQGSWEVPWRRKWHPTPVFLPRKSHRQRSLGAIYMPSLIYIHIFSTSVC